MRHIPVGCHPSFEKFDGVLCPAGQAQSISHVKMTSRIVGSEGEAPLQFRNRLLTLTPKDIHSGFDGVINSAHRCLLRVLDRPRPSLEHAPSGFSLRSGGTRNENTRRPWRASQRRRNCKITHYAYGPRLAGKKDGGGSDYFMA